MRYFVDDDLHFDVTMPFPTVEEAMAEIRRRVALLYEHEDNESPCISPTCGRREYCIYKCEEGDFPFPGEGRKVHVCTISAEGVVWEDDFEEILAKWKAGS